MDRMTSQETRKCFLIGCNKIDAVSYADVLVQIQGWIDAGRETHYVVAANSHVVMEGFHNEKTRRALAGADLVTPDGMPLVLVARLRGFPLRQRTDGPGLMAAALEVGRSNGWRHYFYGSTPEVLAALQTKALDRWPGLQIAGSHSPPFRALTEEEDREIVRQIDAATPDILWVGLGCPKQEHWMLDHKDRIRIPVMVGVGQAFELLAGARKHAPIWMSNLGLEWLYRLASEPRRLWKRYLISNPWFIWQVLKEEMRLRVGRLL